MKGYIYNKYIILFTFTTLSKAAYSSYLVNFNLLQLWP